MQSISLNNVCSLTINSWVPIGDFDSKNPVDSVEAVKIYYSGTFDGNNKEIKNLYISGNDLYRQGLFGGAKEALIKNLTVTGPILACNTSGGICGYFASKSKITNCTIKLM